MLCVISFSAAAQNEVYVDQFTGTAHVAIPLSTSSINGATVALGLNHAASGVKINDAGGMVGVNWGLTGVPSISRDVRGLPDDVVSTNNNRYGWLATGTSGRVNNFLQPGSCTPEPCTTSSESQLISALNALNPNSNRSGDMFDSEPDVFSYSVPGHAGKFVFDLQGNVHTIPFDPIQITAQSASVGASQSSRLGQFTIRTPEGCVYIFSQQEVMRKTLPMRNAPGANYSYQQPTPSVFRKDFDYLPISTQYSSPEIVYVASWYVSTITNQTGEEIRFVYQKCLYNNNNRSLQESYYLNGNGVAVNNNNAEYPSFNWAYSSGKLWLQSISTPTTNTTITYLNVGSSEEKYISQIAVTSTLAQDDDDLLTYNFRYQGVQPIEPNGAGVTWANAKGEAMTMGDNTLRRFLVALDVVEHCADRPGYHFCFQPNNLSTSRVLRARLLGLLPATWLRIRSPAESVHLPGAGEPTNTRGALPLISPGFASGNQRR
jgi:hypothetical protein